MKIISGKYKGRKILGYDIEGTRPTQDRIKESLFGMIQNWLYDSKVLDLFAGSGNLGLESLSNGSISCTFVDHNIKCVNSIKKTIETIEIENTEVLNLDYKKALDLFSKNARKFDIIFLDPPYKYKNLEELLEEITKKDLIEDQGIIVCEYEQDNLNDTYQNLKRIKEKKYGQKNISIYQYLKQEK